MNDKLQFARHWPGWWHWRQYSWKVTWLISLGSCTWHRPGRCPKRPTSTVTWQRLTSASQRTYYHKFWRRFDRDITKIQLGIIFYLWIINEIMSLRAHFEAVVRYYLYTTWPTSFSVCVIDEVDDTEDKLKGHMTNLTGSCTGHQPGPQINLHLHVIDLVDAMWEDKPHTYMSPSTCHRRGQWQVKVYKLTK